VFRHHTFRSHPDQIIHLGSLQQQVVHSIASNKQSYVWTSLCPSTTSSNQQKSVLPCQRKGSQTERLQKVKKKQVGENEEKSNGCPQQIGAKSLCGCEISNSWANLHRGSLLITIFFLALSHGSGIASQSGTFYSRLCTPGGYLTADAIHYPDMFMRARFTYGKRKVYVRTYSTYVVWCVLDMCRDLCIQFPIF
jgi:hypothetical protein